MTTTAVTATPAVEVITTTDIPALGSIAIETLSSWTASNPSSSTPARLPAPESLREPIRVRRDGEVRCLWAECCPL